MMKKRTLKVASALCLMLAVLCSLGLFFGLPVSAQVPDSCESCAQPYVNGFCACEGEASYQPIAQNADGVYEIGNAGQLYRFAAMINSLQIPEGEELTFDARITADIILNDKVTEDGALIEDPSALRPWTPIALYEGPEGSLFDLTLNLDGNGHVISGLYLPLTDTEMYARGLFGYFCNGSISRLGLVDSVIDGGTNFHVGSFVGEAFNVTISNCFSTALVTGGSLYSGGLVGEGDEQTVIENCYFAGKLAKDSTYNNAAIVCEYYPEETIVNCYYAEDAGVGSLVAESVSAEQIASGDLTYRLNGGVTDGTQMWYQTVGEGVPSFVGESVYASLPCPSVFSNSEDALTEKAHSYTVPGTYNTTHHWSASCEDCGDKVDDTAHDCEAEDVCACGYTPQLKIVEEDGTVHYFTDVIKHNYEGSVTVTLLQSVEYDGTFEIRASDVLLDLNGYSLNAGINFYSSYRVVDHSFAKTGVLDGFLAIYTREQISFSNVTFGPATGIYATDGASVTMENVVFLTNDFLQSSTSAENLRIVCAQFREGIVLDDTQELAALLIEGGYYKDADGNVIELTEGQHVLEGAVSIETPLLSVTVGDRTRTYADLESALASIGAEDTARLTLLRDLIYYEEGFILFKKGNVQLDLAGYTVKNAIVEVNEGVSLELLDSSEGQSGTFIAPESVIGINVRANALGLLIRSGNYDTSIDAMASVVIEGGIFADMEIASGRELSVTNGSFTMLTVRYLGGSISLTGGSYDSLDVRGATVADLLAEGYLPVLEDGTFVTDLTEAVIWEAFRIVSHTHDCVFTNDETHHFYGCACGYIEGERIPHDGGVATCEVGKICDECLYEYSPALDHAWNDGEITVYPGCETPGEIVWTCQNDPDHQMTREMTPSGHDWDSGTVSVHPGCDTTGETLYTCLRDPSHTYTEVEEMLGHEWDGGTVTVEPTCITLGEITYTCMRDSSHTYTESSGYGEHSFESSACAVCGAPAAFALRVDGSSDELFFGDVKSMLEFTMSISYETLSITLASDYECPEGSNNYLVFERGQITLDLAGHRLDGYMILLYDADMTVIDSSEEKSGTLSGPTDSYVFYLFAGYSDLTVENGSLSGTVIVMANGNENTSSSRIELNGGTHDLLLVGQHADILISGGEYTQLSLLPDATGSVLICGGTFYSVDNIAGGTLADILSDAPCITYTVADGSPEIDRTLAAYTGSFTAAHDDTHFGTDYQTDDFYHWFECEFGVTTDRERHVFGEDALCEVCAMHAPITLESQETLYSFSTLEEAFHYALQDASSTITLYKNATLDDEHFRELYLNSVEITIDLNGYELSLLPRLFAEYSHIVITDSSEEKNGSIAFTIITTSYGATVELRDVSVDALGSSEVVLEMMNSGELILDGVRFQSAVALYVANEPPFFLDVIFAQGVRVSGSYDVAYLFNVECLLVTDGEGNPPLFADTDEHYDTLVVKHAQTYPVTEWEWDYEMGHRRYCFYCGLLAESGQCSGGEASCEHGEVCTTCGAVWGEPLGHVLEGDRCSVCSKAAPLAVVIGEEKSYFFSAYDAFAYADTFDSARIVLLNHYSFYEEKDVELESADVILDLAGNRFEIREINLYGGTLTVVDSSPAKSGEFYAEATLDVYNGELIFEGGFYEDLYIDLDPEQPGYHASVIIKDGFFEYLNLETDSDYGDNYIVITGGYFEYLDIEIDDPTVVSISGGTMDRIYTDNGTHLYYLDEIINVNDCVKMLDVNGRRLYFDEDQSEINQQVRFVHDPAADAEATLHATKGYHYYACSCGVIGERIAHSGGEATCSELAVCEVCEMAYGKYLPHTYDGRTCTVCDHVATGNVKLEGGGSTEYFESLYDAIQYADSLGEAVTLTLLSDLTEMYLQAYYADFTLDLGGYTLTVERMEIGDAEVVITDTSEEQTGAFVSGEYVFIYEGTLELRGGTYQSMVIYLDTHYSGADVRVSGGSMEKLYLTVGGVSGIPGANTVATVEITGGKIGALNVALNAYLSVSMIGGEIQDGIVLSATDDAEITLGMLLPYACYAFVNESGAFVDTSAIAAYEGYLTVAHTDSAQKKHEGDTHYEQCLCGAILVSEESAYDDACDDTCNVCGAERSVGEHVYDNACDADCNVCEGKRTPAQHVYDNGCDADCNVCTSARAELTHTYDNACDTDCNVCTAKRTVKEHAFGDVQIITEPTSSEDGEGRVICKECGAQATVVIPALGGLSGGAVAAISIASTVVAATGGFSLFWFVIRKKSLAELFSK